MIDYLKHLSPKRIFWMIFGVILISFSISLLRLSSLGTDPFTCFNLGVSSFLGMSFGGFQVCMNLIFLIPMFLYYRRGLGLGTIVSMTCVGYVCDFFMFLWESFGFTPEILLHNLFIRILCMLLALLLLCIGVAFYMECDLGVCPYDALAPMMEFWTKGKLKFSFGRIITDIVCVIVGAVFGSIVGISTVITAFFTGPFVSFFRKHLTSKIVHSTVQ